jgi:hypothetical protein
MRRAVISALFILGLAIPAAVPVAIAAPSSSSEYKSCGNPGQMRKTESWAEFLVCGRGIDGKLLWVTIGIGNSGPGEPQMRACSTAGDRKVFRYWHGNPSSPRQAQYVCANSTADLIKSLKIDAQGHCMVTSSESDYSFSEEKGRCNFAPFRVGQKMWLEIELFRTNKNLPSNEESSEGPAVIYVSKDIPQIPSCYLERSCGPEMMHGLQKVMTEYPNAIVFPPKKTPLNFPPPTLGEVDAQTDCFGSSWCRALGTQDGQIVVEGQGAEWNAYGIKYSISQFFFKLTSPSGKVEFSNKFKFPYEYYFTTFRVKEIGIWSVQIAGWNGIQQTDLVFT